MSESVPGGRGVSSSNIAATGTQGSCSSVWGWHSYKWGSFSGDNIEVWRHLWPPSALIVSGHQAGAVVKAGYGRGQRWAHGLFVLGEDQRQRDVLEMKEV